MKLSRLLLPFVALSSLVAVSSTFAGGSYYNIGVYFKFNIPPEQTGADRVKSMPLPTMAEAGWKYPITQLLGKMNCEETAINAYHQDLDPWQNGKFGVNMDLAFASALANAGQQTSANYVTLSGPICDSKDPVATHEPANLDIYFLSADNVSHMISPFDANETQAYNNNADHGPFFGLVTDNLQGGIIKENRSDDIVAYFATLDAKPTHEKDSHYYPVHTNVLITCDFRFRLTSDQSQIASYNLTNCSFNWF